jgi:hypothetical protein
MKGNPTVGSQFWGAFLSDRIYKATKDVSVHFFIHSGNSCELYQQIPGTFKLLRMNDRNIKLDCEVRTTVSVKMLSFFFMWVERGGGDAV